MLKPDTEFYAEYDEDYEGWCVFDTEDGKAWATYGGRQEAEEEAERRTQQYKKSMRESGLLK